MDELVVEYQDWVSENELFQYDMDAHELLLVDAVVHHGKLLTPEQRKWLNDFIERWDRQQSLVDRIEALRA